MTKNASDDHSLFHPLEHAILCAWLGRPAPACARDIDIHAITDGPVDGPITLNSDTYGKQSDLALSNAVARLVLDGIQGRLPQWALVWPDKVVLGRETTPKRPRSIDLLPQLLFEINWADSGPGYSWPERYSLTYVPVYDVYVVTASNDSTDLYGYTDRALGWFEAAVPVEEGAKSIILGDWQRQAGYGQEHWEAFWDAGLVDLATAYAWAAEAWPEEELEDELYDEDELPLAPAPRALNGTDTRGEDA
jgi:hypothetical protein